MNRQIIFICMVVMVVEIQRSNAQKMTVKDNGGNVLMEVNDEGSVGSITLPSGAAPVVTTNKLYNVGGVLYWNGANIGANHPVHWNDLTNVPAGFADGTDDVGSGDITAVNTAAGSGLTGGVATGDANLAVNFAGTGSATTVTRSDHNHDAAYYTQTQLQNGTASVNWNGLTNVPAGFDDGTDDIGGNTLDEAYDQGGAGAGRTITTDAGAVKIAGTGGLEVDANAVIGASTFSTETLSNAGFSLNGDDVFVAGTAGIEGNVYTDQAFIAGATTTYSDGSITKSSGSALNVNLGGAAGDDFIVDTSTLVVESDNNRVGIGTTSPEFKLSLDNDGGILAKGTFNSGASLTTTGAGTRLIWYPKKAAFRAGYVDGNQWDDANIGEWSSVAMGYNTQASAHSSTAMGKGTTASGSFATAMGNVTTASAHSSTAMGTGTTASGNSSTAMGSGTTASGDYSMAMGWFTTASAHSSTAMNNLATASGKYSTAMGDYTTAQSSTSLVIGRYNVIAGDSTSWVPTDPLFVAGNGTGLADVDRNNALTLYKDGNMTIAGTLTELSDRRFKERIEPVGVVLPKVKALNPVYFEFINKNTHPGGRQIGLIAQDIAPLFPELVKEDARGTLSLNYARMTAVLVQAVKEQQAIIEDLTQRVDALEKR